MNRRELFKRAGELGAGLGLAAVVGTTVPEDPNVWAQRELDKLGFPEYDPAEVRSGYSQVADIGPIRATAITETTTFSDSHEIHMTQTYDYGVRQGGAL